METIEAVEVRRWAFASTFCALKVDGAGNLYEAYIVNNGYDAWVEVFRTTPAGVTTSWRVDPARPPVGDNKADGVALAASGRDLLVLVTSHYTGAPTRPYIGNLALIPGVYVPYVQGAAPEDGPGVTLPTGTGGEPVDYERVRAITREELDLYTGRLRPHIMTKVIQALQDQGVLTLNVDMDAFYAKFSAYDRDRAYEALQAYHEGAKFE